MKDILSRSRRPRIASARFEVWWRLHHDLGLPYSVIAAGTGGYHRSSVSYGVLEWQRRMEAGLTSMGVRQ